MSLNEAISSEIQSLSPSSVIELFILDLTALGGDTFRFHAGTNSLNANVVWQGDTYIRFPVQVTGFDINGSGQLPRPKITVSNVMGTITTLILAYTDLLGAKVVRRRTLAKYLDAVNFDGGVNLTEDPTADYPDDLYYVDRKSSENKDTVEFELASPMDLVGVMLPRRQIVQNLCPWIYRGPECGYTGTVYFDANDNSTSVSTQDVCGKRLTSCRLRFGTNKPLPFGGFPGCGTYR